MIEIRPFDACRHASGYLTKFFNGCFSPGCVEPLISLAQSLNDNTSQLFAGNRGNGVRQPMCFGVFYIQRTITSVFHHSKTDSTIQPPNVTAVIGCAADLTCTQPRSQ